MYCRDGEETLKLVTVEKESKDETGNKCGDRVQRQSECDTENPREKESECGVKE
jgi:hypothetical protein